MKNILIGMIILLSILSCKHADAPEEHDISLENNIEGIDLYYETVFLDTKVLLKNISTKDITELSYTLDGRQITLYDYVHPGEVVLIYYGYHEHYIKLSCKIDTATFY